MFSSFIFQKPLVFMSVSKTFHKGLRPHSKWALRLFHWNFSCSLLSQKGKQCCYLCLWESHQQPTMRWKHLVGADQVPQEVSSLRHCYSRWTASKLKAEEESISYIFKVMVWTLHLEVLKSYERKWRHDLFLFFHVSHPLKVLEEVVGHVLGCCQGFKWASVADSNTFCLY